ncbi:cytochrome P450 2D15-like [Asterias amurensis]|uniref:cytochrome P450 2D15-like n=1 Tax=Asterias amurensis TaxID=7602 RepID=UPI003AB6D5D9
MSAPRQNVSSPHDLGGEYDPLADSWLWAPPPTHTSILVLVNACFMYLLWRDNRRRMMQRGAEPPGPKGIPIIGSLLELRGNPILRLRDIARQYGPIVSIKFGMLKVVMLNDVPTIQEAFVNNSTIFNDRPTFLGVLTGSGTTKGMVSLSSGPFHRNQRLLMADILRSLGIGRTKGEVFFSQSVTTLCNYLTASDQCPIDSIQINKFVFDAFTSFTFGPDWEVNKSLTDLRESPSEILKMNPAMILASQFFPNFIVRNIMPRKYKLEKALRSLLQNTRRRAEENPDTVEDEFDSYVDGIIKIQEQAKRQLAKSNDAALRERAQAFLAPDEHYTLVLFDFFVIGTETSLIGLKWVLQILMVYPEWQRRIQEEIDHVVGVGSDAPSLTHKSKMHVTMATITEVLRFRPVTSLGAPHRVTEDTTLGGYFIPGGTTLITNIYAANTDGALWEEPDRFNPKRFLNPEGKFTVPNKIMTFSTGQRACPGEKWTRSLIYLYITNVLKHFTLKFPNGTPLPDLDGHPGINHAPHEFKICAVPR